MYVVDLVLIPKLPDKNESISEEKFKLMMIKVFSLVKAGSDALRHIELPIVVQKKLVHARQLKETLEKLKKKSM